MLLGFAAWTLLPLTVTVGVYRWSLILTGRAPVHSFRADQPEGADWYRRATRAHAYCIENLPVFGAIVIGLHIGNVASPLVDALAMTILIARILQSTVHVCFVQTSFEASVRFIFYFAQAACFAWLIGIIVAAHTGRA
jgi:uncharacterized MAPEG superfamily protein